MIPLVETIAFVFGLVALGYLAGWTGLLRAPVGDALTSFVIGVALPVLLFRTLVEANFAGAAPFSLWAVYFVAVTAAWVAGQLVTSRVFGRDRKSSIVGGVAASFSNLVLLGLPLIGGLYGREGLEVLSLLIAVHLPVMMAASIILFAWAGRDDGKAANLSSVLRDFAVNLFSNPLIIGIICGLFWRVAGPDIPAFGQRFVDAFADMTGALALFAMGLGLRKMRISGNIAPAMGLLGIKLFVMPAVALAAALAIGLSPFPAMVAVTAASLPSGVNPYLIATRFGTGQAMASNAMTLSTLAAVLSCAMWLAVVQRLFG